MIESSDAVPETAPPPAEPEQQENPADLVLPAEGELALPAENPPYPTSFQYRGLTVPSEFDGPSYYAGYAAGKGW